MYQLMEGYFSRFAKMDKIYRKMCFQAVEEYHFTPNEIVVLMFLSNNRDMDSASDIARFRNISKGLVAKSVESLCRKGFLYTERDQNDRRLIHLRLGEKSADVVERLRLCREAFVRKLEEGIPEENLKNMMYTTELMDRNINEMLKGM